MDKTDRVEREVGLIVRCLTAGPQRGRGSRMDYVTREIGNLGRTVLEKQLTEATQNNTSKSSI